ncbi:MAG TPA: undecaprenyl-phosphate glucose phosphotransferase [Gallionellaceae bacterium]|nr:undecaprenyl-phosphate glucose phosphotransferase [Gallionellaceae bacterium]
MMPYRRGMVRHYGGELSLFHRVLDVVTILAALWLCATLYGVPLGRYYQVAAGGAVAVFMLLAEWQALYESWRAGSIRDEAWKILSVWVLTCVSLVILWFLSKSSVYFSRVTVVGWMVSTPLLLTLERVLLRYTLRHFRKAGMNTRTAAVVGSGGAALEVIDTINASPWMGLRVEGIYDNADAARAKGMEHLDAEALLQRVREQAVDCIYICYPMMHEEKIRSLVEQLADSAVSVYVVPDVFVSDLLRSRWTSLGGVPLVSVFDSRMYGTNVFLKRLEDVVLGSLILLLISPVMLVIAAAVKATSAGPILFKQRRYGMNGEVIEVWKFRSMSVLEDGAVVTQARRNDPRVTRLGAFLRKTSLDELPQFVNVLQGQMSIVGPRPHAVAHNEEYRTLIHGYMLRHMVKPGITGWAQVNGWRGETDTTEKMAMRVKYDLDYINNWTIWFDLKIIVLTLFRGMRGKNAY